MIQAYSIYYGTSISKHDTGIFHACVVQAYSKHDTGVFHVCFEKKTNLEVAEETMDTKSITQSLGST